MTAVSEAVRLLRRESRAWSYVRHQELADAADALGAYFADPPAEEVERLARALYDGAAGTDNDQDAIRAVLKAIGSAP